LMWAHTMYVFLMDQSPQDRIKVISGGLRQFFWDSISSEHAPFVTA